jgi:hypothetical protein
LYPGGGMLEFFPKVTDVWKSEVLLGWQFRVN